MLSSKSKNVFVWHSVSGQLSETFWLPIKSQPIFIAQTSGLHHSIVLCLVSLETEFHFHDEFRCKMMTKILEQVIGELSDSKTNYRTGHRILLITLLWVIGSFKDFCRKFPSYMPTVSGKRFDPKTVVVFALLTKQYACVLLTVW